jgi:dihydroceramidase
MTGTGAYFYIVWCIWLRHCLKERQDEYELRWPSIFSSLPEVVSVERGSTLPAEGINKPVNGHAIRQTNGSLKKGE